MRNNYDISIVIPFLNEEDNIVLLLEKLETAYRDFKKKIQIVFVDDGSTDKSVEIIQKAETQSFSKKVVKLSKNYGSHVAIRAGLLHSEGEYSTFLAADLQEHPENILGFYKLCEEEKHEVLILYREAYKSSFIEKLFSKIYTKLLRVFVSKDFPEKNMSNFFISKKVKEVLNKNIVANSSILLQIYSMGFKQHFVSYRQSARKSGKSKWTFSMKVKLFIDSLISFSYKPLRFITFAGFFFFIFGLIYLIIVLINYYINNNLPTGWPTLISIVLMGFGITNISLGIISEYLWRIFDNTKRLPVFIVSEIIDEEN